MKMMKYCILALTLALAAGCAWLKPGTGGDVSSPKHDYPDGTQFLFVDVGAWPITSTLTAKRTSTGFWISHTKANVWPVQKSTDGDCNANLWIFANRGGQWKAATWEWAKPSTHDRPIKGALGAYIKNDAFAPRSWSPAKGEKIGIMISGMARAKDRNVSERSNIVWLTW